MRLWCGRITGMFTCCHTHLLLAAIGFTLIYVGSVLS